MNNGLYGLAGFTGEALTPPGPIRLTYSFDADANGVFSYIATVCGFANPSGQVNGILMVPKPSVGGGTIGMLTDRAVSDFILNNGAGNWLGVDLGVGRALEVNRYSLRARSTADYWPRSWNLQGSNNVGANTIAGFDAATWTTLRAHAADTALSAINTWYSPTVTPNGIGYRWLRINGILDNYGGTYFCIGEWEFYGSLSI